MEKHNTEEEEDWKGRKSLEEEIVKETNRQLGAKLSICKGRKQSLRRRENRKRRRRYFQKRTSLEKEGNGWRAGRRAKAGRGRI